MAPAVAAPNSEKGEKMAPREAIEVEGERPAPRHESPSAQGSRSVEDAAPQPSLAGEPESVHAHGPWSLSIRLEMMADELARCRYLLERPGGDVEMEAIIVAGRLRATEETLWTLHERVGVDYQTGVESVDAFEREVVGLDLTGDYGLTAHSPEEIGHCKVPGRNEVS